jgi:hypothetical protein
VTQAVALALTVAVETPVVLAIARRAADPPPWLAILLACVGCNLVSHPLLWAAAEALEGTWPYGLRVAVLEVGVVLLETVAYRVVAGLAWRRAFAASLAANVASVALGFLLAAA